MYLSTREYPQNPSFNRLSLDLVKRNNLRFFLVSVGIRQAMLVNLFMIRKSGVSRFGSKEDQLYLFYFTNVCFFVTRLFKTAMQRCVSIMLFSNVL